MLYTENLTLQEKLERASRQQASSGARNHDEVDGGTGNATHAPSVKFQTQHSSSSSKVGKADLNDLQGDTSCCLKPHVDITTKVLFCLAWPCLATPKQNFVF